MNKPKTPLTPVGFKALIQEREHLTKVLRPSVVSKIADAAAEGDRSENAEYIYGKKQLREIDRRLAYLGKLLGEVEIVDCSNLRGDRVCFGSTVVVVNESGLEKKWTIVGQGETEYTADSISYQSPVAKALIGKQINDVVEVETPKGTDELEIVGLYFGEILVAGRDKK